MSRWSLFIFRSVGQRSRSNVNILGKGGISVLQTSIFGIKFWTRKDRNCIWPNCVFSATRSFFSCNLCPDCKVFWAYGLMMSICQSVCCPNLVYLCVLVLEFALQPGYTIYSSLLLTLWLLPWNLNHINKIMVFKFGCQQTSFTVICQLLFP